MNAQFNEEITKAVQTSSLLLGDLRAAYRHAVQQGDTAGELAVILLMDAIADASKLADRLKLIQESVKP